MTICTSCGRVVSGKKFCPACGTPVQPQVLSSCPRCHGEVKPGASFCMHCGSALSVSATPAMPATHTCPACHEQVAGESAFCTNCGQDMRAPASASLYCTHCGYQNPAGTHFCSGCGSQLISNVPAATAYVQSGPQYAQNFQQSVPQQPYPQSQYSQGQYQQGQYQQPQYPQAYGQPQYGQNAYQPQPMMGQAPMVLRCPTCMAMAPLGSTNCISCRTSLAGVMPVAANMPMQGQQGSFLQGNGGKFAMGALGGAAAVVGGEMLLHGVERSIENGVEGDMGFRRHRHRDEGLLGELGEIADDIGL